MAREGLSGFNDDDAAYWTARDTKDKEMAGDLHWLAEQVDTISGANGIKYEHGDEEELWRFSYSGVIYEIGTVNGQGSFTYIRKTDVGGPLEPYA